MGYYLPISPKSSVKFVRKGTKVPCKMTPAVGITESVSSFESVYIIITQHQVFVSILQYFYVHCQQRIYHQH